ncbi:hypothetical protein GIB67_040387 [Kingdonia uniflora]|uniref:Bet v I/Major latex protein domain-containing protein n=1 Tax=Kingdonia uniflora TaxID=39325 RepID=A0A7J7KXJ9_9MAGN|nr:hypothetical protein GIB67_040387 [Kingdonia uniflora]
MHGEVFTVLDVSASADDVWAVFRSPELPNILLQVLPMLFEKIIPVSGDGGAGTVVHIVLTPGMPEPRSWNEQFVTIDDKKKTKVIRMIEGGYLDLGFTKYEIIFNVIEKDANLCTIKATTAFEADEEKFTANATRVTPAATWAFSKGIATYVLQKKVDTDGC